MASKSLWHDALTGRDLRESKDHQLHARVGSCIGDTRAVLSR